MERSQKIAFGILGVFAVVTYAVLVGGAVHKNCDAAACNAGKGSRSCQPCNKPGGFVGSLGFLTGMQKHAVLRGGGAALVSFTVQPHRSAGYTVHLPAGTAESSRPLILSLTLQKPAQLAHVDYSDSTHRSNPPLKTDQSVKFGQANDPTEVNGITLTDQRGSTQDGYAKGSIGVMAGGLLEVTCDSASPCAFKVE